MKFWSKFLKIQWLILWAAFFVGYHTKIDIRDLIVIGVLCITTQLYFLHEDK